MVLLDRYSERSRPNEIFMQIATLAFEGTLSTTCCAWTEILWNNTRTFSLEYRHDDERSLNLSGYSTLVHSDARCDTDLPSSTYSETHITGTTKYWYLIVKQYGEVPHQFLCSLWESNHGPAACKAALLTIEPYG
jgi:hypothetical protein